MTGVRVSLGRAVEGREVRRRIRSFIVLKATIRRMKGPNAD